jgi:hypothetical protein
MPVLAALVMRGRAAAFTVDPAVVSTPGRGAGCMQVRAGASTRVRAAACIQVPAAEFIRDRPEDPTLTGDLGAHALPAPRAQNGPRKTARTKIAKTTGFRLA